VLLMYLFKKIRI